MKQQACKKEAYLHMLHTEPKVQVSDTTKADSSNAVYYIKKAPRKICAALNIRLCKDYLPICSITCGVTPVKLKPPS